MRYVFDARTATDHFPGIGRYTRNLHAALLPLLDQQESLSAIVNSDSRLSANGSTLAISSSNFSLAQQVVVPRLLRERRATLYHSPYYLMPFRPSVPTVLTIYDFIAFYFPEYLSTRARLLFRLAHRLAIRTADAIIVISEATKRDLVKHFNPSVPVYVTPLAAAPHFRPISDRPKTMPLPEKYLLYFGSNKPHKNLTTLIKAFALLPDAPPLVIAGAWLPEHPEPKQLAEQLDLQDRIHFLGRVDSAENVARLYSNASLFLFPSLYEGFGLPVIEAMACGVPVACGDVWSLPEVGGDAVAYFDPNSAEAIAETVSQLLQNNTRRSELAAKGIQRAAAFTWKHTAQQTLAVYRKLCHQH